MRQSLARFSEPVSSVHAPSWADFITATPAFKLSVHTEAAKMTTNLKYFQLLQQIEKNPLRPKVAAAVDIVTDFALDAEAVGLDRRLSPEGKRDKAQGSLRKAL